VSGSTYEPAIPGCLHVLAQDVSSRYPDHRIGCPCGQEFIAGQPVPIEEFGPEKAAGAR
jgi:hypothetical protein